MPKKAEPTFREPTEIDKAMAGIMFGGDMKAYMLVFGKQRRPRKLPAKLFE